MYYKYLYVDYATRPVWCQPSLDWGAFRSPGNFMAADRPATHEVASDLMECCIGTYRTEPLLGISTLRCTKENPCVPPPTRTPAARRAAVRLEVSCYVVRSIVPCRNYYYRRVVINRANYLMYYSRNESPCLIVIQTSLPSVPFRQDSFETL